MKPSTVRKYVLILEEKGYVFLKNDKNQHLYSEGDLDYLRQFKQLIDNSGGGMTLDEDATTVAERFATNETRMGTHSRLIESRRGGLFKKRRSSSD
ncbi:hypothetical protein ABER98_10935 [Domibacillus aminovorans]|uniref:hypothetical protein n=1 Tax=Domibacillus aminovorans TaxID=29332 RepID=UPI003D1A1F9D